ncbi:MAG: hypothetical protein IKF49_06450 [Clostridia bacterium]|nr:hypothetical protein [Clostridia bacterium]
MARILIEYYDPEHINTIMSLLHRQYDSVFILYVQRGGGPSEACKEKLTNFFRSKFGLAPNFIGLKQHTLEAFIERFHSLIKPGNEYEFDITGGSGTFIAAAGYYVGTEQKVQTSVHRYTARTGRMLMQYPGKAEQFPRLLDLTVPDMIGLNGTFLIRGDGAGRMIRSEQHDKELLVLWNIVKKQPVQWNKFCMLRSSITEDGSWARKLTSKEEMQIAQRFFPSLEEAGLIRQLTYAKKGNAEEARFFPAVLSENTELMQKAGAVLERYACYCAMNSGLFSDVRTGVEIDWDGKADTVENPYNEIDVMLAFDEHPVFASCKNREPSKEDLYEISVMTKHFGGKYGIAMLLSTLPAQGSVKERAKEMEVILIDGIGHKNEKGMIARFTEMVGKYRKQTR